MDKEDEDPLTLAFRQAADRHKEDRRIAGLKLEDKIIHYLKMYMEEWKQDLEARPPEAKLTSIGKVVCTTQNHIKRCQLLYDET